MKEEEVKVLSISQLLQNSSPVTSASSLNPSTSDIPSESSAKIYSSGDTFEPYHPSNSTPFKNPNPKILKPLNHPTILIGTITLPFYGDPSTSSPAVFCPKTSFLFSDGSATIACDILDFEPRVIRKRIHVLAWNFIPLERAGGFLEIIRWSLPESINGLFPCSLNSVAYSLSSGSGIDCKKFSKSRYYLHGQLDSVSPVSIVPCKIGVKSGSGQENICGFLTQMLVCDSKYCASKDPVQGNTEGHSINCPTKSVIVYFLGSASSWHPLFSRLVGNVVSLSGLKKKLVFLGKKEESQLMYVTTDKAMFHLPIAHNRDFTFQKTNIEKGNRFGMYTGTITGIYMEGMVVEFDQQVLLLLTDQELTIPLSVRVGAIVSVRNVHFVNPKFSWANSLVLGACCKTSICVKSFSPMDTGCYIRSHSQSLMRKYINSLAFSARLWVLLVVSCFRKKFSGMLPEKQTFGSKHIEGWAQKCISSCLPLSVFRPRHGVFMEYCNHESCGCGNEQNYGGLKLAVPLSNFISHCEATWKKLVLEQNRDSDLIGKNNQYSLLFCEAKSYPQSIRRVLQSEDIGVSLIGKLKISPSSGKLQLVDATGSIDVVIRSTWCSKSIYEIHDFSVVLEGVPGQSDSLGTPINESFLCSTSIFNGVQLVRETSLSVYLYCHLRDDETSRNRPLCPGTDTEATTEEEFGSGRFHLLCVTHKFPMLQNKSSSVFAEAVVIPWDLFISEKDGDDTCPSSKRCKPDVESSSGTHLNSCNLTYPHQIPCFVTGKTLKGHCSACSGTLLHCRKANIKFRSGGGKNGTRKVLLEFESDDSFCKYELLKIGGHYILADNRDALKSDKLVITGKTYMWSVLFSSDEVIPEVGQRLIHTFEEDSLQNELSLFRLTSADSQLELDRCVFLSCDDFDFFAANLKVMKEGFMIEPPILSLGGEVDNNTLTDAAPLEFSGTSTCDYHLPEGNLISLGGYVVGVHDSNLSGGSYCGYDVHQPKIFGVAVCIHVLVDSRNVVRIFSSLSKNAYPTGFGPGVNATFHRILVKGQNVFMLTATSLIVIKSITLVNEKYSEPSCDNPLVPLALNDSTNPEAVPASMISQLIIRCSECKPMKLYCQVMAIYVLVLEKKNTTSALQSQTLFDIPLAGFILDDGSSSCCCWANSKSAATLLRLDVDGGISHHVGMILEKHQRIVVKNYGSMFDSSGQDLRFFACSGKNISSSDGELLKFVILNSCFTSSWSVVGSIMDSNGMGQLEKQLTELNMTMLPPQFHNIRATEVLHTDPVKKAWSIFEELLNSS